MVVYGETNFVLELTFLREDAHRAEEIVNKAERGLVRLVLPAYSLAEPFEAITRRERDRGERAAACRGGDRAAHAVVILAESDVGFTYTLTLGPSFRTAMRGRERAMIFFSRERGVVMHRKRLGKMFGTVTIRAGTRTEVVPQKIVWAGESVLLVPAR